MFDPKSLRRPTETIETRTFTDPYQPGLELTLTMVNPHDYTLKLSIQAMAKGFEDEHSGEGKFPVLADGKPVPISPTLCTVIASVKTMVRTDSVDDWTFEQWATLAAVMPNAFEEIVTWANEMINGVDPASVGEGAVKVPNDSEEHTEELSGPPLNTAS